MSAVTHPISPVPATVPDEPPNRSPLPYQTAAEWYAALGEVPLERIVFDPLPGTATEADVLRLDDHEDRICELVHGTLVEKAMGYLESLIAGRIIYFLNAVVISKRLGLVTGEAGMVKLIRSQIRIPDVAFVSRARLPGGAVPTAPVPRLVPDLAVEILSDSNSRKEMAMKLAEYFEAGTRLVWYVDPKTKTVAVHTAVDQIVTLTEADTITGGDVLPGFEAKVAEFFDVA